MFSVSWKKAGCRLIALVLIVSIVGCGWKVTPPKFDGKEASPRPITDVSGTVKMTHPGN